ncbi:MAG: nucleotide exchange factor GrpE [Planctomycetes bacterium]|nr:nucleotide exchange factor GrpE [Planctomycetota bacterium]
MEKETENTETTAPPPDAETRIAELEGRWLRAQADYQNARRRMQQELESSLLRTLQPLLDELLLVLDYLDLALSATATTSEAKALGAGVAMTRAKLAAALELVDVRVIPTAGRFDPTQHEAGESRAAEEHAPGTILATLRPGYTWQNRILRPARVVVASAPVDGAGSGAAPEKASD